MILYIVRHGEAEPRAATDAQRSLTERGSRGVDTLWRELRSEGVELARLFSSPFVRARQTAALVAGHYPGLVPQTLPNLTPDDSPGSVLEWLAQQSTDTPMALVSHMPLVGLLCGLLTEGEGGRVPFMVGEVACLDLEYPASASARLIWMRSPVDI